MIDLLTEIWAERLLTWLSDWSLHFADSLITCTNWLKNCLIDKLTVGVTNWLINRLEGWQLVWMTDWLIDSINEWLNSCLHDWLIICRPPRFGSQFELAQSFACQANSSLSHWKLFGLPSNTCYSPQCPPASMFIKFILFHIVDIRKHSIWLPEATVCPTYATLANMQKSKFYLTFNFT